MTNEEGLMESAEVSVVGLSAAAKRSALSGDTVPAVQVQMQSDDGNVRIELFVDPASAPPFRARSRVTFERLGAGPNGIRDLSRDT